VQALEVRSDAIDSAPLARLFGDPEPRTGQARLKRALPCSVSRW
jgi:hypothetical protein